MKILILFCLFSFNFCAQITELIIPWNNEADTMSHGYFSKVDSQGNIFVLVNNMEYFDFSGALIEGPFNYGFGIYKFDQNLNQIWKKAYQSCDFSAQQKSEPINFLIEHNLLYLPYTRYESVTLCEDSLTARVTERVGNIIIRPEDGAVDLDYVDFYDPFCTSEGLKAHGVLSDSSFINLVTNNYTDSNYIIKRNKFGDLKSKRSVVLPEAVMMPNRYLWEKESNSMYTFYYSNQDNDSKIVKFDTSGNYSIIANLTYNITKIKLKNNIIYCTSQKNDTLIITAFDMQGNLVNQLKTIEKSCSDFEVSDQGVVYYVTNKNPVVENPEELPITLYQLDSSFQNIKYIKLGSIYAAAIHIQLRENSILMTGAVVTTGIIDSINRAPDKLYLASVPIDAIQTSLFLEENNFAGNLKIYPNPAKDKITVRLGQASNLKESITISIINLYGQVIKSYEIFDTNQFEIDLSFFESGVYMLRIESDTFQNKNMKKTKMQKLIIQ